MHRELLLLGVLRSGDMHGYRLNEFLNRDMAYCADIKKATAYRLLQKMAQDGWILELSEQVGNRPPRTIYQITSTGEAAFQKLLRSNLADYSMSYSTGEVGIAFVDAIPPQEAIDLLKERLQKTQADLVGLEQAMVHGAHAGKSLTWVLEYKQRFLLSEISWLSEIIERLHKEI